MIYKYEIITPISNKNKPYYSSRKELVIPNINYAYKWFIPVSRNNEHTFDKEYFILFSTDKFDTQCRKTSTDNGGRFCINITGDIKDFIDNEIKIRGNIDIEYLESEGLYDVWKII